MKKRVLAIIAVLSLFNAGGAVYDPAAAAPASGGPFLWATSGSGSGFTTVIDATADTLAATTAGGGSRNIAFTPDGAFAYANDAFRDELVVIDTTTLQVERRIPLPADPHDIIFTHDGKKAYVSVATGLYTMDVATDALTGPLPALPGGRFALTHDGSKLYVTDQSSVHAVDVATETLLATIPVFNTPVDIAITPDDRRAYVTHFRSSSLAVIDTVNDVALPSINLGSATTFQIDIDSTGTRAFVASTVPAKLFVIDLTTDTVANSIVPGNYPYGVAVHPDDSRVYVSDHYVAQVHVFDANTLAPVAPSIPVGGNAFYLRFQPDPGPTLVAIDIKPGSDPNSINIGSNGNVPVAILSSADFDATTVDPLTVTLASGEVWLKGNGTPMASFSDVDGDGRTDIVVHVATESLLLSDDDAEAVLEGETHDGTAFTGTDTVRIVPQDP